MLPRFFIGIDAGASTGLAVWNALSERFEKLLTTDFWSALDVVAQYDPDQVVVVIESPQLNLPLFDRGHQGHQREKIAQNVGSNKRESQLLAEGLSRKGYRVRRVRPRSGKLTAAAFRRLTGYQGRMSQHARDAAMLVFGLKRIAERSFGPQELPRSPGEATLSLYAPPDGPHDKR